MDRPGVEQHADAVPSDAVNPNAICLMLDHVAGCFGRRVRESGLTPRSNRSAPSQDRPAKRAHIERRGIVLKVIAELGGELGRKRHSDAGCRRQFKLELKLNYLLTALLDTCSLLPSNGRGC